MVVLALAGCASAAGTGATGGAPTEGGTESAQAGVELTRVGEAVQLTEDAERTHECEFVAYLPLPSMDASDVNAMRALRNEAGRAGANLVLLVMGSRTTITRAEGYLCAD